MKKMIILIYVRDNKQEKVIRRCNGKLIQFLLGKNEQNIIEKAILFIARRFAIFSISPFALQIWETESESIKMPISKKFNKYRNSQIKVVVEKIEKENIYLKFFIKIDKLDNLILMETGKYFVELCDPKEIILEL